MSVQHLCVKIIEQIIVIKTVTKINFLFSLNMDTIFDEIQD